MAFDDLLRQAPAEPQFELAREGNPARMSRW